MKKILLLTFFFNLFFFSYGQEDHLWTKITADNIPASQKLARKSIPSGADVYALDLDLMKSKLAAAPDRTESKTKAGIVISFPNASGIIENFRVYEASVMHPALAARYTDIKSYAGIGIDDPTATIRFSITLFGLHTMTFSGKENTTYIDPYTTDLAKYVVYRKDQLPSDNSFECLVSEQTDFHLRNANTTQSSTQIFRTYRLALSSTIEYSAFHVNAANLNAGTLPQKKAAVLAAMVVTMTRVNGVYERDVAVTMQIIPNNDVLINIISDNLTNTDGPSLLSENQNFVDTNIGSSNYDIGHIFSTGGGGIAQLGSVCSVAKARGVTGLGAPVGDAYDIDYVAHEMGHQFGGNHTFNSNEGSCQGNRNNATAVEPGSGTTIMAYAGICPPHNVQSNSDAHFSAISLAEIDSFLATGGNCSVNAVITNTPPVISPLQNFTIPKSTPFVLKGNATDAENDPLTYCWEQTNNEVSTQPPISSNVNGPNFRSRPPSASPNRYMPVLSSVVLNNITPAYEVVPSVVRTLNFALTVRDNNIFDGPQTKRANMTVTIANVGPFAVTSPTNALSWVAGSNQTVTWDVAGTTANNINCNYVDIYLSTNGGTSFPTLLASGVPNDGSELITVPNFVGSTNRIMVMANDNLFYDVSNFNFTITAPPSTFLLAYNGVPDTQNQTGCAGSNIVYTLNYATLGGFNGSTTFSVTGNPAGTVATFSPNPANANGPVTLTISNTSGLTEGFYPMVVTATSAATTKNVNLYLNGIDALFLPLNLTSPANMATNQPANVNLTWTLDSFNADSYDVQVATDNSFTNVINSGTVATNSFTTSGLVSNTSYFWHVRPRLSACAGPYTSTFQFSTGTLGIDETSLFNFAVYPNPNNGSFNIQSDKLTADNIMVAVYDIRGRLIFEKNYSGNNSFNENIQLKNAQAGIYLLAVTDGEHKEVKRIIVK